MALLDIITAPDPRLKKKAQPVERVDAAMAKLMTEMLETMYAAPGVGLAAPQVGVLKRIIVVRRFFIRLIRLVLLLTVFLLIRTNRVPRFIGTRWA